MSYIKQIETEFAGILERSEGKDFLVRWVSEKILESYKNGIAAGRRRAAAKPKAGGTAVGSSNETK